MGERPFLDAKELDLSAKEEPGETQDYESQKEKRGRQGRRFAQETIIDQVENPEGGDTIRRGNQEDDDAQRRDGPDERHDES